MKILYNYTPQNNLAIAILFIVAIACSDEKVASRDYPVVDTYTITDINEQGATLNGAILDLADGVVNHGFIYGSVNIFSSNAFYLDTISMGNSSEAGKFSAIANRNLENGKTYFVRSFAIAKSGKIVLGQEKSFVAKGSAPPVIKDFNPKQATIGDTIVIAGSGFSTSSNFNKVLFNQIETFVIKARSDSLWVTVPSYAGVADSLISVVVGSQKAVAIEKFKLKKMTATSFEPSVIAFGDTISIYGTNFPLNLTMSHATIFKKEATIVSATRTVLKVIPTLEPLALTSTIVVNVGPQSAVLQGPITFQPPVISSFTPTKGTFNTVVTLSGKYFHPDNTKDVVTLGGKTLTVTAATRTSLTVKLPSGITPGNYPFSISIIGINSTSTTQFEVIKPVITAVTPLNGTWGTTVTITGSNFGSFAGNNIVMFGPFPAQVISNLPNELKVTVPAELTDISSPITVQVTTVDNLTATSPSPFVLDKPEITSFTPTEGKLGTLVTITGKNFRPTTGNTVSFGNKPLEIVSQTATQLVVKANGAADISDYFTVAAAGQNGVSATTFHLISPWRQITNFVGGPRGNMVSFSIGSYGYIGYGNEANSPKSFYKYDPGTNLWSSTAPVDVLGFGEFGLGYTSVNAFTIGNFGYVAGGYFVGSSGGSTIRYDPSTNSWAQVKSLDVYNANLRNAVGFSVGDKGYLATGLENSGLTSKKTMQYDPATDTWSALPNFPGTARHEASSFTIGTEGYVIGGSPCSGCTNYFRDAWKFDTSNSTWTRIADLPGPQYAATGFSINGKGYLVVGLDDNNSNWNGRIFMYDPSLNTWQVVSASPGDARIGAVAFIIGNKAYFGTGAGINGRLNDFWEFDPSKL